MVGYEARSCKRWSGERHRAGCEGEGELVARDGEVAAGIVAAGCDLGVCRAGKMVSEVSVRRSWDLSQ